MIADVIMPRMGGQALYEALTEQAPDLPFLFCSGYTGVALSADTLDKANCDFLAKPFSSDALFDKVNRLLAHRRAQAASSQDATLAAEVLNLRVPSRG